MIPPTDVEREVAARVAGLVPDGATVQFGIGRLPDAIAAALVHHRGLAVHSGLVTDALVELVEAGAVDPGRTSVIGAAVGTSALYDLLARSPWIEVHPYTGTHDPAVLAAVPGLAAMNSALEIDLTGQIGAEVVGGAHLGAVGGQSDFLRGAVRSPGGIPIVACVSTTGGGRRSRIVERLDSGVVTTARSDAGLVVTEHGVADLRGPHAPPAGRGSGGGGRPGLQGRAGGGRVAGDQRGEAPMSEPGGRATQEHRPSRRLRAERSSVPPRAARLTNEEGHR